MVFSGFCLQNLTKFPFIEVELVNFLRGCCQRYLRQPIIVLLIHVATHQSIHLAMHSSQKPSIFHSAIYHAIHSSSDPSIRPFIRPAIYPTTRPSIQSSIHTLNYPAIDPLSVSFVKTSIPFSNPSI